MLRILRLVPIFLLVALSLTRSVASAPMDFRARIDAVLTQPGLDHAVVGVLVKSLTDGRTLYERNADLALIPASNQKLLTSAAALSLLGPEYRFQTFLFSGGTVDASGVLNGDLVLRGGGDPSLTLTGLAALADSVKTAGIRSVTGRILADDTRFDTRRLGDSWSWDDEAAAYQPQISALCFNENVVAVTVAPGPKSGAPARVTLTPDTDYVTVQNTALTAPSGEATLAVDRARGQNKILVSGSQPIGAKPFTVRVTVEDPALFAARLFRDLLRDRGIRVANPEIRGPTPPTAVIIGKGASAPLSVLTRFAFKQSDNLYEEVFLKTLGAETTGEGSGAEGAGGRALRAFLRSAKVDTDALAIADGSGLSTHNLVTPRVLVSLLAYMDHDAPPAARTVYRDALPVGGVDGTLGTRFRGTPAAGNVRAKTGTLGIAVSLSGYATTKAGEPLVFSILINHYLRGARAAREARDAIVLALLDAPKP